MARADHLIEQYPYFRLWHQTDLPLSVPHVRSQGMSGPIPDAAQGLSLTQLGHSARSASELS
jgi:hypothetical protein